MFAVFLVVFLELLIVVGVTVSSFELLYIYTNTCKSDTDVRVVEHASMT